MSWDGLKGEIKGTPEFRTIPLEEAIESARYNADNYFPRASSEDWDFSSLTHMGNSDLRRADDGGYIIDADSPECVLLRNAERNDGCHVYYIEALCNLIYEATLREPSYVSDVMVTITPNTDEFPTFQKQEMCLLLIDPKKAAEHVQEAHEAIMLRESTRPYKLPEWAAGGDSTEFVSYSVKTEKRED